MKKKEFMQRYYEKNIEITKRRIRESVNKDNFIIQCIGNIEEINKTINLLGRRLREWYGLYNPELARNIENHKEFVSLIVDGNDKKRNSSMGAGLSDEDKRPIKMLAKSIRNLYRLQENQEKYLDDLMKGYARNVFTIAGGLIGGKLIAHAGSLKRLSLMTASTIQVLGAEKALFRHMKTGARAPKHGLILQHQYLQTARPKDRGKAARAFADKISLAAKVDYFKGEFIGNKLKKELEKKLGLSDP